jgi:AraC-like DNA-binding protein
MIVKSELDKLDVSYTSVELGEVQLEKPMNEITKEHLKQALHRSGLEVMDNKDAILIEKIINIIIEMIHYSDELPNVNFSTFLSEKLQQDYHKMATLFSKTKGITIEHFIIRHKIEKVKELITYDELSLTEISYKMHYSSVAHLSRQFKQVTGFTPSFFKHQLGRKRSNLEDL